MNSQRLLSFAPAVFLVAACSGGAASTGGDTSSGGDSGADGPSGSTGPDASTGSDGGAADATTDGSSPGPGADASAGKDGTTGGADGAANSPDATTGGGDGGPADAGTPADGAGSLVAPTNVAGTSKYRFTFGDLVLEVDQSTGARVDTLSFGTTNLVATPVADATMWGSTFWTSPRSEWQPVTWPPPASIDTDAYTGGPSNGHLVVASGIDPTMGISIAKDYSMEAATGWIDVAYTIHVTSAFKAAPWEDTRVPRGGLAFFPGGMLLDGGPLMVTSTGGIVWFDDSAESVTSPNGDKAIADAKGGWSAYALNGVLFLKKFADVPVASLAPGEGDVDIYPGTTFLELEVQGAFTSIPTNGSLSFGTQWRVAKIPAQVTVSVGSATLVSFAEELAAM